MKVEKIERKGVRLLYEVKLERKMKSELER